MKHTTVLQKKGRKSTELPLCDQEKYSVVISKLLFHLCCGFMITEVMNSLNHHHLNHRFEITFYKPPPPPPLRN